jgi:SEC-C motif
MRELTGHGILIGSVAPIWIDEYVAWCDERGDNPADEGSRAAYAADLERLGPTVPWPPRRNERCWCGSGSKYKSCCGSISPASPEPLAPA